MKKEQISKYKWKYLGFGKFVVENTKNNMRTRIKGGKDLKKLFYILKIRIG